ncbi:MAG: hypothetical protein KME35_18030 [Aphanocapsa sp. GSE-SYN-MK-11-07L]|jgi:hypothetical protein|nr:hypothetical protein [Aphanocapsa sp. GSE-SYN-MK-11-07L]
MGSLLTLVLIVVYAGGGWKFWQGFNRTNFSQNKLMLTLFWPLLLVNKSYRQNFNRALKG